MNICSINRNDMQFGRKQLCRYNRNQHAVWVEYAIVLAMITVVIQVGMYNLMLMMSDAFLVERPLSLVRSILPKQIIASLLISDRCLWTNIARI